jgi:hypothetical protein
MLNPLYDEGIQAIDEAAGRNIERMYLPESVGVPPEIGDLIKYLLDEHDAPKHVYGFEIQLLNKNDYELTKLFDEDASFKKHYAIPNNYGFYRNGYEPHIEKDDSFTKSCSSDCKEQHCSRKGIPMLCAKIRDKYKFFCSEQIMPNFALSAYELISREVESVYLKLPEEIDVATIQQSMQKGTPPYERNWKKQHLYVLMTRATLRLVVNIENDALYSYLVDKLNKIPR